MADPHLSPVSGHVRRLSLGGGPLARDSSVLLADYLDAAGEPLPPDVAPLSPGHVKTEDSGGRPYVGAWVWGGARTRWNGMRARAARQPLPNALAEPLPPPVAWCM